MFTTKASLSFWDADYHEGDFLIFGRESKGLPESLLRQNPDHCLRIPMLPTARSLNLATSVGIGLFEALRHLRQGGGPILPNPQNLAPAICASEGP
jgi:tRNA (cytidine/uridine-2'-O-)-methyltransferase